MEDSTEQHITSQEEFEKLIFWSDEPSNIVANSIELPVSKRSYTFEECEINHLKLQLTHIGDRQNVKLNNCKISTVEINIQTEDGFLELNDKTEIGFLNFKNSKYHKIGSEDGVVVDVLNIDRGVVKLPDIKDLFPNKVIISNVERVLGNIFGLQFHLINCDNYAHLNLVDANTLTRKIRIKEVKSLKFNVNNIVKPDLDIKIHACNIIEVLTLKDSSFSSLVIEKSNLQNGELLDVNLNALRFEMTSDNQLTIGSLNQAKKSYISNFQLKAESPSNTHLFINKVDFSKIFFSEHIQFENLRLDLVKVNENVDFQGLDLKNASLKNVNFSNCKEILLLRSSLSETVFTNIQWPPGNKIVKLKKLNSIESWQQREVYRQLKENHIKNSNSLDAKLFDRNELDVYLKLIKEKRGDNIFKKTYWRNVGDYLILASNKYLGGWGQNFWRPLFWLFFIHLLLFSTLALIYEFNFEPWRPGYNNFSWDATWEGLAAYLFFLNPLHRFVINGEVQYSIIDFFIRISSGYFIFYFLRATRKYH